MKRFWRRTATPAGDRWQRRRPLPDLVVPGSRTSGLHAIDDLIGELRSAGALDEGSGEALDALIETWHLQQLEILRVYHLDRLDVHEETLSHLQTRLAQAELEAAGAQRKADELSDLLRNEVTQRDATDVWHPGSIATKRDEEAA